MAKNVYEMFDEFIKAPTREEKIKALRNNNGLPLQLVLKHTFDPTIEFDIISANYKPSDAPPGMGYSNIVHAFDRLYLFIKNNPRIDPNLTVERKRQILAQILESLEAEEAKVFLGVLNKKQDVPDLDYAIVKEAYPNLIP